MALTLRSFPLIGSRRGHAVPSRRQARTVLPRFAPRPQGLQSTDESVAFAAELPLRRRSMLPWASIFPNVTPLPGRREESNRPSLGGP